jgi:putative endonuclease
MQGYRTYILFSPSRDRFYIGHTADLGARLRQHLSGATRSTASVDDWQVVFIQTATSRRDAMALESAIKGSKSRRSVSRYIADNRNELKAPVPAIRLARPLT